MNKFIKPATLTVPKEVEEFLTVVDEYCDEKDIDFCNLIYAIVTGETSIHGIEITYEDWAEA